MVLVNGGFLHYMDMKKFLKNLLSRNRWSDFEIISHDSGFDISGRPIAVIATGKMPSSFLSPPGKVKFSVRFSQLGSLSPIPEVFGLINKWIFNCLRNS